MEATLRNGAIAIPAVPGSGALYNKSFVSRVHVQDKGQAVIEERSVDAEVDGLGFLPFGVTAERQGTNAGLGVSGSRRAVGAVDVVEGATDRTASGLRSCSPECSGSRSYPSWRAVSGQKRWHCPGRGH